MIKTKDQLKLTIRYFKRPKGRKKNFQIFEVNLLSLIFVLIIKIIAKNLEFKMFKF